MASDLHQSNEVVTRLAERLVSTIRELNSVAVAFSGGVDSAVVAKAAMLALGQKAVAVTAVSPSLAKSEREVASREAAAIGIRHIEISTDEFENSDYRANAGDRCFYCKDTLYAMTRGQLEKLGVTCIVNGSNIDDLGDYRPGMQAAKDHDVRSPLIESQMNKSQVRMLARYWQLSVAEKPASPCLSSRISYGVEVTPARVRRVELAEAFLKQQLGIAQLRVRIEANEMARIEVPLVDLSRFTEPDVGQAVSAEFRRLGFRSVTLDLEGFRSGNLNDSLQFVSLGQ